MSPALLRVIALGIAFVLLLVTALIDDDPGRGQIVALALIGVAFGMTLAQLAQSRRLVS